MAPYDIFSASPEKGGPAKTAALKRLLAEIQQGWESAQSDNWISEEDAYHVLGIETLLK